MSCDLLRMEISHHSIVIILFCFKIGQSYEIRMLNRKLVEYTDISSKYVKVGVRFDLLDFFLHLFLCSMECNQVHLLTDFEVLEYFTFLLFQSTFDDMFRGCTFTLPCVSLVTVYICFY